MRVVFVGAGGVGGYFGGLLAEAGVEVTYLARGAHGEAIRRDGLLLRLPDREVRVRPRVVLPEDPVPASDLYVMAVKHRDFAAALDRIAPRVPQGAVVLSLLNGIGHDEPMRIALPRAARLLGTAFLGASIEAPGVVRQTSEGRIALGPETPGASETARVVGETLSRGGFPVKVVEDVRPIQWRKLLWNASFNCVNTLEGGTCADLMRSPAHVAHLREIMQEIAAVARAEGIDFAPEWVEQSMTAEVNFTPYVTSMRLDRERGRMLELEPILLRPLARARAHGVSTPRLKGLAESLSSLHGLRPRT